MGRQHALACVAGAAGIALATASACGEPISLQPAADAGNTSSSGATDVPDGCAPMRCPAPEAGVFCDDFERSDLDDNHNWTVVGPDSHRLFLNATGCDHGLHSDFGTPGERSGRGLWRIVRDVDHTDVTVSADLTIHFNAMVGSTAKEPKTVLMAVAESPAAFDVQRYAGLELWPAGAMLVVREGLNPLQAQPVTLQSDRKLHVRWRVKLGLLGFLQLWVDSDTPAINLGPAPTTSNLTLAKTLSPYVFVGIESDPGASGVTVLVDNLMVRTTPP